MGKVIVSEMVSIDGYFAGPNGEIDWHNVDAEFNEFAIRQLDTADLLLFGRVTYDLMVSWWPTPDGIKDDPEVARRMNALKKIVFSKTLHDPQWNNTETRTEINAEEIQKLKQSSDKNILIFGSGTIVRACTTLNLIDEYRLIVAPVVLGSGKSFFAGVEKHKLKRVEAKPLGSENVLLTYQP